MKFIVSDTINFLSKTFPKIYSSFYLEYLKQYASTYSVNKTQLRALITLKNNGAISMTALCNKLNIEKGSLTSMVDDLTKKGYVSQVFLLLFYIFFFNNVCFVVFIETIKHFCWISVTD